MVLNLSFQKSNLLPLLLNYYHVRPTTWRPDEGSTNAEGVRPQEGCIKDALCLLIQCYKVRILKVPAGRNVWFCHSGTSVSFSCFSFITHSWAIVSICKSSWTEIHSSWLQRGWQLLNSGRRVHPAVRQTGRRNRWGVGGLRPRADEEPIWLTLAFVHVSAPLLFWH